MKKTVSLLIALGLSFSTASFASGTIHGTEALNLARIIQPSAVDINHGNAYKLVGVTCEARMAYTDNCFLYSSMQDPATHVKEISGDDASKIWKYLHHAGFQNTIGVNSDGTAGEPLISSGTIVCTFSSKICTFNDNWGE